MRDIAKSPPLFDRIGGRNQLSRLLRHFYADVRQHAILGPIFNQQIDDWPTHLEKIADFWSNVTGGPVLYNGPMPFKHLSLGLKAEHFETWLDLWQRNCRIQLGAQEAAELIATATEIGERLQVMISNARPK
jgi:hemoglobin